MNNLSLSGHRKPSRLILSMSSHSWVSLREGIKSRGCAKRGLRDNKGSSGNCWVTHASSGKVAGTGRCFLLTGLYCLLASHHHGVWYWTETWDGRTWAWVFCCTGRDWIVKEFRIFELEFEVGIDELMRGETWVSVSLMSLRTESDWKVRCRHNSRRLLEGASDKSLHGEKDDDDDNGDDGDGQINDYSCRRQWGFVLEQCILPRLLRQIQLYAITRYHCSVLWYWSCFELAMVVHIRSRMVRFQPKSWK